jgi:hypothetical protein
VQFPLGDDAWRLGHEQGQEVEGLRRQMHGVGAAHQLTRRRIQRERAEACHGTFPGDSLDFARFLPGHRSQSYRNIQGV